MNKIFKASLISILIIFTPFLLNIQSMAYISPLTDQDSSQFISFTDILNRHRQKNSQLALLINKKVAGIKTDNISQNQGSVVSRTKKIKNIRIVFFGDSMIETMGDYAHLEFLLSQFDTIGSIDIKNFGVGAQNIVDALPRLERTLAEENIDSSTIFVLGSFAYNPLAGGDSALDQYSQSLDKAIQLISDYKAKPYILLSLAPNVDVFGLGPKGTNWDYTQRFEQVQTIKQYIKAARRVAGLRNITLIDAYTNSINGNGEGLSAYINKDDGIHPSSQGIIFISKIIADKLISGIL